MGIGVQAVATASGIQRWDPACRSVDERAESLNLHLENLEISHQDQVWVADITYVRLNGRFIYVCLLMDVFTRIIKAWRSVSTSTNL